MQPPNDELMMWADDGAWFQYRDEYGRIRTNFMGHCDTLDGLKKYCRENGIRLEIFSRRPATAIRKSVPADTEPNPLRSPRREKSFA